MRHGTPARRAKAGETPNMLTELVKGAVIASAASLLLIALCAVVLWRQWLGAEAVPAMNAGVKVISAALAGLVAARRCPNRAWLWGALAGLLYAGVAWAVFAILSDTFPFSAAVLSDAGTGLLAGMLAAMVARALK